MASGRHESSGRGRIGGNFDALGQFSGFSGLGVAGERTNQIFLCPRDVSTFEANATEQAPVLRRGSSAINTVFQRVQRLRPAFTPGIGDTQKPFNLGSLFVRRVRVLECAEKDQACSIRVPAL